MKRFRQGSTGEDRNVFSSKNPAGDHHLCQGATPIKDCIERRKQTVCGVVHSMVLPPSGDFSRVELEVTDGSGTIVLVFMGRQGLSGVTTGTHISATGVITRRGSERVLYSPAYELHSCS